MACALHFCHPFRHLWPPSLSLTHTHSLSLSLLSLSLSLSMTPSQPPKDEAKNKLLFGLPDDIKYPLNTFLEALLRLCRASNDLK